MIRHLFVPGLLGPMLGLEQEGRLALPRLESLLARADRLVEPVGYVEALFALFGIGAGGDVDLPTAALCFQADTGEAPAGFLLHADPLQLLPDLDRLLALDLDDDPLDGREIAELVKAFNLHFGDDGLGLYGSPSGRIYMHCDQAASIRTHPLSSVIGRSLDLYLPDGEDRRLWRARLNEIQMLCHTLEFNREREAGGRPMLGGLWFSGGGGLPPAGQGPVARVVGDDLLARGLLASCTRVGGDELIIEHAPGRAMMRADPRAWLQALASLEGRMAGLLQDCAELHVHPANGTVYRWHPRSAWRVWRRKRSLLECLDTNPGGKPRLEV